MVLALQNRHKDSNAYYFSSLVNMNRGQVTGTSQCFDLRVSFSALTFVLGHLAFSGPFLEQVDEETKGELANPIPF